MNEIIITGDQLAELIGSRQVFVKTGAFTLPVNTDMLVRRATSICQSYSIQLFYELEGSNFYILDSAKIKKRKAMAT